MHRLRGHPCGRAAAGSSARLLVLGCLLALANLAALVSPGVARAGVAPTVVTDTVPQAISATQELVAGTVNPRGQSTTYSVEYATAGSRWCTSNGTQGTPQQAPVPAATLQYTDSSPHAVSVDVSGLTGGNGYCAMVVATNATGTTPGTTTDVNGVVAPITFVAGLPVVSTTAANPAGVQRASIQGTVDPAGQATTYFAAYDLAGSAWCQGTGQTPSYETTPTALPQQDALAHPVTVAIAQSGQTPLAPDTTYCAAIGAGNGSSSAAGAAVVGSPTLTFTTPPAVTTTAVESTSATTAQLSGSVNPDGVSTTYYAVYDQVGSNWCQGNGGSPAFQTSPVTLGASDQSTHPVTVDLSGLTTGTTYCVALRSDNAPLGVSDGGQAPPITAGLPTATTTDVAADAPTTAALDGTVGPSGQSTTYDVLYDLQSSQWCVSGGTLGAASHVTSAQALPETDTATHDVSVHLTGLTPGQPYCAALAAQNSSNGQSGSPPQSAGSTMAFVAGFAPGAGQASVADQSATASVVSGTVDAEGQSTTFHVAYASTDSNWCNGGAGSPDATTAETAAPATDTSDHPVSATIIGLQGGATYCAAVVATNGSGSTTGPTVQFTAGLPSATGSATSAVAPTSETVSGTITPTGQSTSYSVAYDVASSPWCQGGGDPASAGFHTSSVVLPATDDTAHAVSVTIGGLAPGEDYCDELVAVNGSGVAPAAAQTFTAGFPFSATTSGTSALADTSATVDGTVNPAGLPTSYWIGYDLQDSDWCSSDGQSGLPADTTAPVVLPATDTADHTVGAPLSGLSPGTAYCAVLIAGNDMGDATGTPVDFTTTGSATPAGTAAGSPTVPGPPAVPSLPPTGPTPGPPSKVAVRTTTAGSPTAASVTATIDPDGQATSYRAAYALARSRFCVSSGADGVARSTPSTALPYTDSRPHQVTIALTGLTAATRYCVQVVAQNASGTTRGVIAVVTTTAGPRLSDLTLAPARFRAARPAAILPSGFGTTITFRASQPGRVRFTVVRRGRGHGHVIGRFDAAATGRLDHVAFSGRVAGRLLTAGRYELQAVAIDQWGLSSGSASVRFTIR